jgi:hypothetical protein
VQQQSEQIETNAPEVEREHTPEVSQPEFRLDDSGGLQYEIERSTAVVQQDSGTITTLGGEPTLCELEQEQEEDDLEALRERKVSPSFQLVRTPKTGKDTAPELITCTHDQKQSPQ